MKRYLFIILLFCSSLIQAQSSLLTGLSAYFKFDETSGFEAISQVNNTEIGASYDAVTVINQIGKIGKCPLFTTSNDNVAGMSISALQMYSSDCAASAWIYATTLVGGGYALTIIGAQNGGAMFYVTPTTGLLRLNARNVNSAPISDLAVTINTWHHVGFSYDQTANELTYYLDEEYDTVSWNQSFTGAAASSVIGQVDVGDLTNGFVGKIDELGIWKKKLTQAEFATLNNSGSALTYPFSAPETYSNTQYVQMTNNNIKLVQMPNGNKKLYYVNIIPPYIPSVIDYLTMYDGTCPSGGTRYTDYDCADNTFTYWSANTIKDTTDYTEVIYIDPAFSGTESGTISHPYNSWNDFSFTTGYAYVQKRGTTYTQSTNITIASDKDNILIGAYGTGAKPIIICSTTPQATFMVFGSDVQFQGLDIQGSGDDDNTVGIDGNGIIYARGGSDNMVVYDCVLREGYQGFMSWSNNIRIINTEVYDCFSDGIWAAQFDFIEISHCNIHDINKAYLVDPSEEGSGGDGIQLENGWRNAWIHNTIVDRSNSGNKFCLLASSHTITPVSEKAIYEFNTFIAPIAQPCVNVYQGLSHITKYNTFVGTGVESSGMWEESTGDSIIGNTFSGFETAIIKGSSSNVIISHNTFYNNENIFFGVFTAYNNIFHIGSGQSVGYAASTEDQNMFDGGTAWANSFYGSADFVDAANGNFDILFSSDAIDQGVALSYYDFDKSLKTIVGNPDVGAYEY